MRFLRAREKWLPKWKGRPKPPPRYFARRYFRRPSGSPSAWVRGVPATAETQRRWPRPMPRIPAFRRSARSVRFIFFAISDSGVRAFECPLSSRTSSFVHGLPLAVFFCATNRCSRRILTRRHLYRGWPARAKRGPKRPSRCHPTPFAAKILAPPRRPRATCSSPRRVALERFSRDAQFQQLSHCLQSATSAA